MQLLDIDINSPEISMVECRSAGWVGTIPVRAFQEALEEEKVPVRVWPTLPSDNACLLRALSTLKSRTSLIRPLKRGRGFTLVLEDKDNLDLETKTGDSHNIELTIRVERGEFDGHLPSLRITPDNHPQAQYIRSQFEMFRGTGENGDLGLFEAHTDLSAWFTQRVIPWCGGVTTQAGGGTYVVFQGPGLDNLKRAARALERISQYQKVDVPLGNSKIEVRRVRLGGAIEMKPEIPTQAAIAHVVGKILDRTDTQLDTLDDTIEKASSPTVLKNIGTKALELQQELESYEEALGIRLDEVRQRLEEARQKVATSFLGSLRPPSH